MDFWLDSEYNSLNNFIKIQQIGGLFLYTHTVVYSIY